MANERYGFSDIQLSVADNTTGLINIGRPNDNSDGLHALIIGVGSYPYLDADKSLSMGNLDGPAITAINIAKYLLYAESLGELTSPLRTLRLLVSPSPNELALNISVPAGTPQARAASIRDAAYAWRADAATSAKNVTLFYFAGHGIQRLSTEGVLLAEDALQLGPGGILDRAFDVNNLYNGMAADQHGNAATMAQTQYYFFDACRVPLKELRKFDGPLPPQLFDVYAGLADSRTAPRFFAAAPGHSAYTTAEGTLFGKDLFDCLEGAGADYLKIENVSAWFVTVDTLAKALNHFTRKWNDSFGTMLKRDFDVGKTSKYHPLIKKTRAPFVRCKLAHHVNGGRKIAVAGQTWPCPPPPVITELEGGRYEIKVLNNNDTALVADNFSVLPPEFEVDLPLPLGPFPPSTSVQPTPGPAPTFPSGAKNALITTAPIDLRDSANVLISRTTIAGLQKIFPGPIAAGKYTVTPVLGATSSAKEATTIEVGDGGSVEPHELDKVYEYLAISLPAATGDLGNPRAESPEEPKVTPFTVPKLSGTPPVFRRPAAIPESDITLERVGEMTLVRPKRREQVLLQVRSAGQSTLNIVIPQQGTLSIHFDKTTKGICVSQYFCDPFINEIVRLRKEQQFSALKAIANAARMDDLLVGYSIYNPAAALLIGYLLLRAQEIDAVERSLSNLPDENTRSAMEPDATILLGECASLKGRSKEALELFLDASRKGLPSFSFGQSYLVERLQLYSQAYKEDRAAETLVALEPFCLFAKYDCFFNCYSGESPEKPGLSSFK